MQKKQNKIKLSIVIPVLNEGENLKALLKILKSVVDYDYEAVVVYDIEGDTSIPVVKNLQKNYSNLALVHNEIGRGVINAIRCGVKYAAGKYVLVIAADDIGSLLSINDMVVLMDNGCEIVNATRYAYSGRHIGGVFLSSIISRMANSMFYILSGCSLTDPTLGVKIFNRSQFNELNLESKPIGWAVSFELAIKAQIAGWKLGEVPVISLNRIYGKSKSSFKLKWLMEYLKWFWFGMKMLPFFKGKRKVLVKIPEIMKK